MYFPYLRGKQYELLALKEYAPLLGESGRVVPVIEPVKARDGGLQRCLDALRAHGVRPIVIINPLVGELFSHGISPSLAEFINNNTDDASWRLGILASEGLSVTRVLGDLRELVTAPYELALIHDGLVADLEELREETIRLNRRFDLVSDHIRRRHVAKFFDSSTGVIMHDGFPREDRNADYLLRGESIFSEDALFYQDEGYEGFGDYATIGKEWVTGGFMPRAVAIHWTYQPAPDRPIMIRHFASKSNDDTANVGGKFLEALEKLVGFLDRQDIHTRAAEVMRGHLGASTYPGLGVVKKLSVQNHLELMMGITGRS